MVHCGYIPTVIFGRVFPLPLPFKFVFASFVAKILLLTNPLFTCCGVLHSCVGACLSKKVLSV